MFFAPSNSDVPSDPERENQEWLRVSLLVSSMLHSQWQSTSRLGTVSSIGTLARILRPAAIDREWLLQSKSHRSREKQLSFFDICFSARTILLCCSSFRHSRTHGSESRILGRQTRCLCWCISTDHCRSWASVRVCFPSEQENENEKSSSSILVIHCVTFYHYCEMQIIHKVTNWTCRRRVRVHWLVSSLGDQMINVMRSWARTNNVPI